MNHEANKMVFVVPYPQKIKKKKKIYDLKKKIWMKWYAQISSQCDSGSCPFQLSTFGIFLSTSDTLLMVRRDHLKIAETSPRARTRAWPTTAPPPFQISRPYVYNKSCSSGSPSSYYKQNTFTKIIINN